MTVELPDTEGAVRSYLRAHADVAAVVTARVWFAMPNTPTFPCVIVTEIAGTDDTSEAPLDQSMLRIDCWGSLHGNGNPDKAAATAVRLAVRQALYDLRTPADVVLGEEPDEVTVRLAGAFVQSTTYLPDPTDGRPRYSIVTNITAHRLVSA